MCTWTYISDRKRMCDLNLEDVTQWGWIRFPRYSKLTANIFRLFDSQLWDVSENYESDQKYTENTILKPFATSLSASSASLLCVSPCTALEGVMGGLTSKYLEEVMHTPPRHTHVLPSDPRSPSDNITRTPISVSRPRVPPWCLWTQKSIGLGIMGCYR